MKLVASIQTLQTVRRLVLSAVLVGLAIVAAPGARADQLDQVLANRVLRVAVPKEFPPFGYTRDGTTTKRALVLKDSPCHIGVRKHEPRLLARVNQFVVQAGESQVLTVNGMTWFRATFPPDFFARSRQPR